MKNFLLLFALLFVVFNLSSCKKDGLESIEIIFINPVNNQVLTAEQAENLEITITLRAERDLEEFFVKVSPQNNPSDLIVDASKHSHRNELTVNYSRDLSLYPSGTIFLLSVEACSNHVCNATISESIQFSII